MLRRTTLYEEHSQAKAHFVDFAGWEMPLHYGSQIDEHHQVRQHLGIFDVSHMGIVDIKGEDATSFLRFLLANDIAKLKEPCRALYSCILNDTGGVIDDLIVYYLSHSHYRLVINAATREKDVAWMKKQSRSYQVSVNEEPKMCIIAIQGPEVFSVAQKVFDEAINVKLTQLKPFQFILSDDLLIARTGYTGEDGLEMILPDAQAHELWQRAVRGGVRPCGLGARDTLRLEAGLNLYGTDMDETTSPLCSNLGWTVSWDDPNRNFIGRTALENQLDRGIEEQLIGLIMEEPGVLRNHQKIWLNNQQKGEITSGSFSPTLKQAIALARIPNEAFEVASIERRGKQIPVKIIKPPFVCRGKKTF
ncbi:glycine cleavage system protein T [Coxiella-like endosymbiont of Rhipicephalus sanguineus]|uniref:glycine cleavage system aminomethyltransferase GcvT n=1 Tax=Coxiella-like endosymbiont of Rhipicephalus sanguineus TaxID=1955402 RepID=UPI00203F0D52|nr:glycine cleavage system aminomethyltransferase GcvT [Coxiella-like endosymbiont of Rhipicephalus sanguineus]MBT8506695.1 glycine cleavage system protein T [Coxiella-like endosymbiont of Rhipicephalus sanguineus]